MKKVIVSGPIVLLCLFCGFSLQAAVPAGNAFVYQGRLVLDGMAVDQQSDFQFTLWNDPLAGEQFGPTLTFDGHGSNPAPIDVSNGLFTVVLDFEENVFTGNARWLEIQVRVPSGAGAYTTLTPRQELHPAPYAHGLSLPYTGLSDTGSNAFSMTNHGMGRAGNFMITNTTNTEAALNAVSLGSSPAGGFLNDSGGTALIARSTYSGKAIDAETPGFDSNSKAIHSRITQNNAGQHSAAVRGENASLATQTYGIWGSSDGPGWGVYGDSLTGRGVMGEVTSDFGFGVYGRGAGPSSTGVRGVHESTSGEYAGVWGTTQSLTAQAAGVRGEALSTGSGMTFGVHGRSLGLRGNGVRGEGDVGVYGTGITVGVHGEAGDILGEGVHGEGATGVYGIGDVSGVTGQAADTASYGVWAIGYGGRLSQPALRADGQNGQAIYALGGQAIYGEGTEVGVRGVTWEPNGVGGSFTNFADGVALSVDGRAEVDGTLAVNVLEITGGADLAERFEVRGDASPGMVVSIDPDRPGKLRICDQPYDHCVVGVISGANQLDAGVVLGAGESSGAQPVALSGRVWVHCTAEQQAVEPGDFLTSSHLAGVAMPVIDRDRADGAIIGKAMSRLPAGERGMVLVLVNLK